MTHALVLSATARRAFDALGADLRRVWGGRFVGLVASGPTTSVAFAESISPADLEAFGALVETWHREDLDTPLLLTVVEFRRSVDAFPLEYSAILGRHEVIAGTPPFAGVVIEPAHLRRACEVQARSHLIHLREGWVESAGHDAHLAELIARSAAPLRALLANVARLQRAVGTQEIEQTEGDDRSAAEAGIRLVGLSPSLLMDILALEDAPERARQLVPRLPEYLSAAEQLWAFVDAWRA